MHVYIQLLVHECYVDFLINIHNNMPIIYIKSLIHNLNIVTNILTFSRFRTLSQNLWDRISYIYPFP